MAKPRIFVSSTYYDLKHIRASLEAFIHSLGYEAVLSEKGNIAFNPEIPLDESCYREAQNCDVLVLIIGGRYGSPASGQKEKISTEFFDRYESITKKEYESVINQDIPVYILIDSSVNSEYETFKKNKANKDVNYAHVESINIFYFIEHILSQPRNNPIHKFENYSEIENWLKEQWAGLFKELISKKSSDKQLSSLSKQVEELANLNTTLKNYLENVVSKVSNEKEAKSLISSEEKRLKETKALNEFRANEIVSALVVGHNFPLDIVKDVFSNSDSFEDLIDKLGEKSVLYSPRKLKTDAMKINWKKDKSYPDNVNSALKTLGLKPLKFKSK